MNPTPFELNETNFDWIKDNYSEILNAVKVTDIRSLVRECSIKTKLGYTNCLEDGQWVAYGTLYNPCQVLKPRPAATKITDDILIYFHDDIPVHCGIGGNDVRYYDIYTPNIQEVDWMAGKVKVEEFHSTNRKAAPCVDSVGYSQDECWHRVSQEFIIREAGCYLPAITGVIARYQECRNFSAYQAIMQARTKLRMDGNLPEFDELQMDGDTSHANNFWKEDELAAFEVETRKCLPSCHHAVYIIEKDNMYDNFDISFLKLGLSSDAMNVLQVMEHFVMSPCDL